MAGHPPDCLLGRPAAVLRTLAPFRGFPSKARDLQQLRPDILRRDVFQHRASVAHRGRCRQSLYTEPEKQPAYPDRPPSVLQDRAAGLVILLAYGSLAILLSPLSWRGFPLWIFYLLPWIGIAAALFLFFKGPRFYRRFLKPHSQTLTPGAILRIMVYSLIYSGLVLLVFKQVTAPAGHRVGIVSFSALFPLITIGTMLSVTLGGLGIREWLYVEALSLVGVPRDQALVISLATSAIYLLVNPAGILFLPAIPRELWPQAFGFQGNRIRSDTARIEFLRGMI